MGDTLRDLEHETRRKMPNSDEYFQKTISVYKERFGAEPSGKEETVICGIEKITKRKVGEGYMYSLYSGTNLENVYRTNVESFASFAKTARENGLKVEIKHHNGVISNLEVLDENIEVH